MLADERAILDAPEPLSHAEPRQQPLFCASEPERSSGDAELVGFLSVDDPRLGIGQQTVGQGAHC